MTEFVATPAAKYKEQFKLEVLVETGCFNGAGILHGKNIGFEEQNIYSCDIRRVAVEQCLNIFPAAHIYPDESITFFKRILPTIDQPTLFWLDAHYPMHYGIATETAIEKMPLFEELKLIRTLKQNYQRDVIICDDMRVIADVNNPRYRPGEIPAYYYVENSWNDFVASMADTHDIVSDLVGEGVAIFYPRA